VVGRQRDPQLPAAVVPKPAQQPRNHQPLETQCRDISDAARQPPLAMPQSRDAHEQHEMAAHQR
jgi:hypothetical protein